MTVIREELKYQLPLVLSLQDVMEVSKEFGTPIHKLEDDTYIIEDYDFSYIKDANMYNVFDKYNIIVGQNENNFEVCLVSKYSKEEVLETLESGILGTDTFIRMEDDFLEEFKNDAVKHILSLIEKTKDLLADDDFMISHEDMLDSIDSQLAGTGEGIIAGIKYKGSRYTLFNPCKGIYAICKDQDEVRFIDKNRFENLIKYMHLDVIENYWNLIGDADYQKVMHSTNSVLMISNRLISLSMILNFNGLSVKGTKIKFKEKRLFLKSLKNFKIL